MHARFRDIHDAKEIFESMKTNYEFDCFDHVGFWARHAWVCNLILDIFSGMVVDRTQT